MFSRCCTQLSNWFQGHELNKHMQKEQNENYSQEVNNKGISWLHSKYSEVIFAFISFSESVFAPIIIDPFLIAMIATKRERWIRYTVNAIVFSILGGLVGYLLGLLFFDYIGVWIIDAYGLTNYFVSIQDDINQSAFAFILLGAFTPVPYKLVAIAAGLVQVNLATFIVASIIGRVLRLGLVGVATYYVGPHALPIIRRHLFMMASLVGVVLTLYIIWSFLT